MPIIPSRYSEACNVEYPWFQPPAMYPSSTPYVSPLTITLYPSDEPEPVKRLHPDDIEAIARRVAELIRP